MVLTALPTSLEKGDGNPHVGHAQNERRLNPPSDRDSGTWGACRQRHTHCEIARSLYRSTLARPLLLNVAHCCSGRIGGAGNVASRLARFKVVAVA